MKFDPLVIRFPSPREGGPGSSSISNFLHPREVRAIHILVSRILREIPVELVQASLFGSKARGEGRAESDVDTLMVFRWLPADREPYAGDAEIIAEEVAAVSGVPVTVWSVALVDLEEGRRTPMLVDALADAIPVWCMDRPLPRLPFTPVDALRCGEALLRRVSEGSVEYSAAVSNADWQAATRRARDDIVRSCTALLLLRGITRPRRAEAIRLAARYEYGPGSAPAWVESVLDWAASSYGHDGRQENGNVPAPPFHPLHIAAVVEHLRVRVLAAGDRLVPARATRPPAASTEV